MQRLQLHQAACRLTQQPRWQITINHCMTSLLKGNCDIVLLLELGTVALPKVLLTFTTAQVLSHFYRSAFPFWALLQTISPRKAWKLHVARDLKFLFGLRLAEGMSRELPLSSSIELKGVPWETSLIYSLANSKAKTVSNLHKSF